MDKINSILTIVSEYSQISTEQAEQLSLFYDLLTEKNKVMNLTRITDFDEAVTKHFADALAADSYFDFNRPLKVLDLGCGAGIPGIPLKIAHPLLDMTLLDSVGKKIGFVNEAIGVLGLQDAKGLHGRAEEFAKDPAFREQYDVVLSRAVANLSTLAEYCLPFVKKGGMMIAYKAGDCAEEVTAAGRAIATCGGGPARCISYEVSGMGRTLVLISKEKTTPRIYPRKAGTPSKSPL